MHFVSHNVKLLKQGPGIQGMLEHIERCGRTAYCSEDKIADGSSIKFVDMLKERGHLSPCEHGTIYLSVPSSHSTHSALPVIKHSSATSIVYMGNDELITTNYRVILENSEEHVIEKFMCEPSDYHIKRVSFKITCSRGIANELVRHRRFSFTQESTRYCNYSKEKFDGLSFVIPACLKDDVKDGDEFTTADLDTSKIVFTLLEKKRTPATMLFVSTYVGAESAYLELIKEGNRPENARDVLPIGLKTDIVMTGSIPEWKGFLSLRSPAYGKDVHVHPDMAIIADEIYDILRSEGYLNNENND